MANERGQQVRSPTPSGSLVPEPGPQLSGVVGGVVRQPMVLRPPPHPRPDWSPGRNQGHRVFAVGGGVVRPQAEVQGGPPEHRADGDGADRRDSALAVPRLLDRRLASRGIGAADGRIELEARLIEEDQVGLATLGLLDDPGQFLTSSVGDLLRVGCSVRKWFPLRESQAGSRSRSPRNGRFPLHFAAPGAFFCDFSPRAPTARGFVA